MNDILGKIAQALANLEGNNLTKYVKEALEQKIPVIDILEKGLKRGLADVGQRFENKEYFLSELLFGASIMEDAMKILSPYLQNESLVKKGKIVLGTVRGDIHDIGKNIFKMFAEGSGFEVYDLGVDVDPTAFVQTVADKKPDVLGLSALLTTTIQEMKTVIDELKKTGIRDGVKVLLGGNAVTDEFGKEAGADAIAVDAVQGVNICKGWAEK
ncbi:cobalamin B12-binding domain-containing protein [[Eubacterium] cellulosolvens]